MLPGTSAAIFAIFPCDELDDGKRWLKNDYSVSCIDGNWSHDAFKFYGLIMILIFPIGIPLSYSILLLRRRKRLNPRGAARSEIKRMLAKDRTLEEEVTLRRESDNSLQSTVFLWGSYRPHAWWFEIFECCRRLALTGALVFIRQGEKEEGGGKGGKPLRLILTLNFSRPGSQTQIAIGLLICISSSLIFALTWPYATMRDNVLGILTQVQLVGTLFAAMMYKMGQTSLQTYDQNGTGWLLIILNSTVFLIIIVWCTYEIIGDEGPGLRSREKFWLTQASFFVTGGNVNSRYNAAGLQNEHAGISMRTFGSGGKGGKGGKGPGGFVAKSFGKPVLGAERGTQPPPFNKKKAETLRQKSHVFSMQSFRHDGEGEGEGEGKGKGEGEGEGGGKEEDVESGAVERKNENENGGNGNLNDNGIGGGENEKNRTSSYFECSNPITSGGNGGGGGGLRNDNIGGGGGNDSFMSAASRIGSSRLGSSRLLASTFGFGKKTKKEKKKGKEEEEEEKEEDLEKKEEEENSKLNSTRKTETLRTSSFSQLETNNNTNSLPKNWTTILDEDTQTEYYYNSITEETKWERPQTQLS